MWCGDFLCVLCWPNVEPHHNLPSLHMCCEVCMPTSHEQHAFSKGDFSACWAGAVSFTASCSVCHRDLMVRPGPNTRQMHHTHIQSLPFTPIAWASQKA